MKLLNKIEKKTTTKNRMYKRNIFSDWAAASEPNLLKIRLKQSVIERKARAGPLAARRQERLLQAAQRRLKQQHQSSLIGSSMYIRRIYSLSQIIRSIGRIKIKINK